MIDVKRFAALLEDRRKMLLDISDTAQWGAQTVELDQSKVGRLSRMDALQMQAMSQEAIRRRELELKNIKAALDRIRSGEYGYCLDCDEEIASGRLEIEPACTLCIKCASQLE